jgi:replicative DNA helicase
MTISLEKIFFVWILQNKSFFSKVESNYFRNKEIETIYRIVKKYLVENPEAEVPSPKQIWEMVSLEDRDGLITREIFKAILTTSLSEYNEDHFIRPKIATWILTNRMKSGGVDIIEELRSLDNKVELEEIQTSAGKIREIVDLMSKVELEDDEDLGSDFDVAESHVQDNSKFKVKSGFETIDHMLGGGWDIQTLNCVMAETSNGKSLWMQNFACKSADNGFNVLYITLEMSERKVMKRLGSMRLKVPINDYDRISKDTPLISRKIEALKSQGQDMGQDLFEKKLGKIITKFWAAGTATVADFDNFIQKLRDKRGIKIDLIIVDYITLVAPPKGIGGDSLYIRGKNIAEGLRALGAKWNAPVITGIQVAKDAWNSSDITLESVPESKAIAETADTFFAIIRTEEMKRAKYYRFKLLKQRDGDFLRSQIKINLNDSYLTLENDQFIDQ